MLFFHLSDLHIGLRLLGRDLTEDQRHALHQVVDYAKEKHPDAVVIAGDIYDKAIPSAEAVAIFDEFLTSLAEAVPDAEIMMISGNHDSGTRVNQYRSILAPHHIHMIGLPPMKEEEHIERVTLTDKYGNVNFYLLPFVKPSMERSLLMTEEDEGSLSYEETLRRLLGRETINETERNVIVSHQFFLPKGQDPDKIERADSEIMTVGNIDEVPSDILAPFDYAALGHIHKPMKVGSETIRYSGTPLACSVSEAGQKKGIITVTLEEKESVKTEVLPLVPLHEVRSVKGLLEEVLKAPSDDYVSVTITDPVDLDLTDMQDRLRDAFPNLLEIRREMPNKIDYSSGITRGEEMKDPFSLIESFLGNDLTEEEAGLLRDVVNEAEGGEAR
ncbi:MAG: exonuclease SbcCD subunit D [Lachnospiraceae bacterium]|nr:exonuclease SbcCD subunit D [Lachnospiraceae bacterium]